jgi:Zn-dependent protease
VDFSPDKILSFVLIAYSIILHEIAHGYAALKFGDPTAERLDRLTLNPLAHIDPVGTVLFPLLQLVATGGVMLGWAKPVPVQTHNLEPRVAGEIVVSVAGVAVNFAIAFAMAVLLGFDWIAPAGSSLVRVFTGVLIANIALGVFNLVPIPPLDGSHVAKYLLPPRIREEYEKIGFYGTFILLLLISQGALRPITNPPIQFLYGFLVENVTLRLRAL